MNFGTTAAGPPLTDAPTPLINCQIGTRMFKLIPAWALAALLSAVTLQAQAAVEVRGVKFADTATVA